ncbi:unnamed protein product [Diabrotica balteata]|uniref:Arrestin C-terminal-like domain-containing protein n=1 Tax=Diabrotica balteata TaxID=107213 RepID=A0A9N9XAT0_DIABA|nr:unnamed protein product [Diabrotica balteata]
MSCRIILSNPGTYHPGDIVYGRVVCDFTSTESFRGIRCKFRGREHTAWTERESYYDSSSKSTKWRTVHYSGDNKFLSVNLNLVGECTLQAGHYEYEFSFTIPRSGIPNPYNGNYGYIRYYIKANVDKAFAFDYEDEVTLHLIVPINFNDIQHELQLSPVNYQDEKTICCMCCASDPITMDVFLEKEAFVVGEVANIKVEVTNMSNESISELNLTLKMTIESKTTSPRTHHKYDNELIALTSATGVGAHGQRTYTFDFQIPHNAMIPNFAGSYLFKQWCVLNVEAVIPGCHSNLDISTGVKLGHIPLIGNQFPPSQVNMIPVHEAPGGAFPSRTMYDDPSSNPPPYPPEGEKAPPYPTGPASGFPVPNGAGFSGAPYPEKGMPMPMPPGGASSSGASAPREDGTPSAPSKAQLAEKDSFEMIDDGASEPPPPSYQDSMKGDFSSNPTAPSAPPK